MGKTVIDFAKARSDRDLRAFVRRCEAAAAAMPVWLLDADHQPVRCTLDEWVAFRRDFEGNCRVAESVVGKVRISTVFLGIDHGFGHSKLPILFETMAFEADGRSSDCWRCATWDEALKAHAEMVREVESRAA